MPRPAPRVWAGLCAALALAAAVAGQGDGSNRGVPEEWVEDASLYMASWSVNRYVEESCTSFNPSKPWLSWQSASAFCQKIERGFVFDLNKEQLLDDGGSFARAKFMRGFCVKPTPTSITRDLHIETFKDANGCDKDAAETFVFEGLTLARISTAGKIEKQTANNSLVEIVVSERVFETCFPKAVDPSGAIISEFFHTVSCIEVEQIPLRSGNRGRLRALAGDQIPVHSELRRALQDGNNETMQTMPPMLRLKQVKQGGVQSGTINCDSSSWNGSGPLRDVLVGSSTYGQDVVFTENKCASVLLSNGQVVSFKGSCDAIAESAQPASLAVWYGSCEQGNEAALAKKEEQQGETCLVSEFADEPPTPGNSAPQATVAFAATCEYAPNVTKVDEGNDNNNNNTKEGSGSEGDETLPTSKPIIVGSPANDLGGILIAILPIAVVFAFVVYVCITRRNDRDEARSKGSLHGRKQPAVGSGQVTRTAEINTRLGFSLAIGKVQGGRGATTGPERGDDDDASTDLEGSGGLAGFSVGSDGLADSREFAIDAREVELGKLIGKGAHGKVYEGTFQGSAVAVKEFLGGRSKKSFARELRNLQALKHPNVIRLFGMVVQDTPPTGTRRMLVMERAQYSLAAFVASRGQRRAPFENGATITTLLQWAQQICSGCSFIHSKNLIHFDIKPENLLLDGAWNIKICDLGISRTVKSAVRAPSTNGQEGGTPSYTAPELLAGERATITKAVDVYSFGVVLWQLFHSGPPHPATWTLIRLLTEVTDKGYRPPIDDVLPDALATLLKASWSAQPTARPSFDRLVREFDHLLGPRSVDVASKLAGRPPFEKGQKVFVWDHANLRFLSADAAVVKENANADGSFVVRSGAEETVVMPQDLLLCTNLLHTYSVSD